MITKDNFKSVLLALNFIENENIFSKHFSNIDAYLKVDFSKNELIYPEDKGFEVNGEFTCNFSSPENFVVFECVHRLFEKGYKPEHIELEPKWKVGHGASGGRADILVKDNSGKSLLIIESKTEGVEFKKEWNNTLQRGGQLFTYAKQAGTTQFVCLYASDFIDGKVIPLHYIISLKDNEKLLEEIKDKKPLSFKDAKALEVEDIYLAWKLTYNLDFATKGIFEDDILPYQIGKEKYNLNDLSEISSKDIQRKYHEFATIMRQHNVAGRENAFDKLVNLFLCKIVDEKNNATNLQFNWKGISIDDYFSLQERLQTLYQAGMDAFLGEKTINIERGLIYDTFKYVINDPDATRDKILQYFKEMKYFTNSDFSFIDVHNEGLFYQNSEVLLKIVKMLQDIKLQTENSNQFLGDMFEGFLDNGVKQSEGQFFTPMPIVKFILHALPIEIIIKDNEFPPKAIDYACGSGHFLNELASQIKPFVANKLSNIKDYFANIKGIEKEYRLSKVAKVSAFMYGQNEIDIHYGDALAKNEKIEDNDYSILVANPPFAVKGFLETLTEIDRKSFTLLDAIDDKSWANNNSIETFFIERAKQLLKPGAVAGIILPSSILSNDATVYTSTREIILKYFQIVAITEFGSQTFGKTGTNTVTLFLRRKKENPAPADHWKIRVDAWFAENKAVAVYDDSNYIRNYCNHIEVDVTDYKTLLKGEPSDKLLQTEIFVDYKKAFENTTEIKNLLKQKTFKEKPKAEQETELKKRFTEYLQEVEKDKLYFYVLASENKQKVLVVKCPTDNKEQKQFLGYEWSSAKGNEGIKYINQTSVSVDVDDAETKELVQKISGLHNINTPLYNPNNRNDNTKINHYIQENFLGNELSVIESLSSYVSYHNLTDMLDFSRVSFNKQITLSPKKNTIIQSKWDLVKLGEICELKAGGTPLRSNNLFWSNGKIKWLKISDFKDFDEITETEEYITELGLKNSTAKILEKNTVVVTIFATIGRVAIVKDIMTTNQAIVGLIIKNQATVLPYYLMNAIYSNIDILKAEAMGMAQPNINSTKLANFKIPHPPIEIQEKIVDECIAIDKELEKANIEIEKARNEIAEVVNTKLNKGDFRKLKDIVEINKFTKDPTTTPNTEFIYVDIESIGKGTGKISYEQKILGANAPSRARRLAPKNSTIISTVRPNLKGFAFIENEIDAIYSTGFAILQSKNETELNSKLIFYSFIYSTELMNQMSNTMHGGSYPSLNKNDIENFKIPVPPFAEQQKLIKEIEKLEDKIKVEQAKIDSSAYKKKEIMEKYL